MPGYPLKYCLEKCRAPFQTDESEEQEISDRNMEWQASHLQMEAQDHPRGRAFLTKWKAHPASEHLLHLKIACEGYKVLLGQIPFPELSEAMGPFKEMGVCEHWLTSDHSGFLSVAKAATHRYIGAEL